MQDKQPSIVYPFTLCYYSECGYLLEVARFYYSSFGNRFTDSYPWIYYEIYFFFIVTRFTGTGNVAVEDSIEGERSSSRSAVEKGTTIARDSKNRVTASLRFVRTSKRPSQHRPFGKNFSFLKFSVRRCYFQFSDSSNLSAE